MKEIQLFAMEDAFVEPAQTYGHRNGEIGGKTMKQNPDYSASAVMLTNPPQVEGLLRDFQNQETALQQLRNEADALIPKFLKDKIVHAGEMLSVTSKAIRAAIDEFGSFQDTDNGRYAVKQRREFVNYKPELVRQYAPSKVASFVLIESVDSKALDALIKAGQLTPEQARQCGEVKESFAYIIK